MISSDIAFTRSVKSIQQQKGSRAAYRRMEEAGGWQTEVTADLAAFLAEQRTAYLATVNADGQPYIQHRGGPAGFIRTLDAHTLGFADYRGNRQYITLGNLADNPKAHLFVMDYVHRRRVKIWGTLEAIEGDAVLLQSLMPQGYKATPERALLFRVAAWDSNCPQHIPMMIPADDAAAALAERDAKIAELTAKLENMR
ncbi:MAG: pyridoxamine 5'-phosphate oxidase family protein [Rhodospirillales bacterium]|jgi:predicted pyridoxine 5'-phosphate oxidase superfamily flavin-nucleotide-binding protein